MEKKKMLFTILFAWVMVIDWLYATQNGYYRMVALNSLGILMAILTIRCYPYDKEKYRRPDICWLLLWGIGSILGWGIWKQVKGSINIWQYVMAAVAVGSLGLTWIRLIFTRFWERKRSTLSLAAGVCFGVMSLCMVCSRYYEIWQLWFFLMFLGFYLTKMEKEDEHVMWDCLSKGIIAAFFGIQIWTYGFRPYDEVRYHGPYSNTNMAALFYLITYMMVLYRIHILHHWEKEAGADRKRLRYWKLFYYVLAGGLVSFVFFTVCRTALLVLIGLTFLFGLISDLWCLKEKLYRVVLRGSALLFCAVITFPCVYGTIRYLPCILHRPVWFADEYKVEKVHSFDSWDSWKYVSLEEFLETAVGRISFLTMPLDEEPSLEDAEPELMEDLLEEVSETPAPQYAEILEEQAVKETTQEKMTEESVLSEKEPMEEPAEKAETETPAPLLQGTDALNSGKIRIEIWKRYLSDLNWNGHTVAEGYYQITEAYHAWHAQNILLQMMYAYGIPTGILFLLLMIWYGCRSILLIYQKKSPEAILPFMIFVVFMGFGMLECVWYAGQAILILMYLAARLFINAGEMCRDSRESGS